MPATVKSKVGSPWGIKDALGKILCCLSRKKFRYKSRISSTVRYFIAAADSGSLPFYPLYPRFLILSNGVKVVNRPWCRSARCVPAHQEIIEQYPDNGGSRYGNEHAGDPHELTADQHSKNDR